MSPVVIDTDDDELEQRRVTALAAVDLTEDELSRRIHAGQASPDEYDAWHEVKAVRFLLDQG